MGNQLAAPAPRQGVEPLAELPMVFKEALGERRRLHGWSSVRKHVLSPHSGAQG